MKRVSLITSILVAIQMVSFGQKLRIDNRTDYEIKSIVVYYERIEGRHEYEYKSQGALGRPDYKYSTPRIETDTIDYNKKIKLRKQDTCTFEFIVDNKTSLFVFGFIPSDKKVLELKTNTYVLGKANDQVCEDTAEIRMSHHYIDLYFNFINNSDYTVYSICPHISDEKETRGSILANEPDRKLIPKENRKILVAANRTMESYNEKMTIDFLLYVVDKNGELFRAELKGISLGVDNIEITNSEVLYK